MTSRSDIEVLQRMLDMPIPDPTPEQAAAAADVIRSYLGPDADDVLAMLGLVAS